MAMSFRYQPPTINGLAAVAAAVKLGERAGAEVLLAKSQPLVPVDKGALVASGHLDEGEGLGVAVVYSAVNPNDGFDYASRQHEEMSFAHEHGQAKYLEQPMHADHEAIIAAAAAPVAAVFR